MAVLVNNIQDRVDIPEELLSLLEKLGEYVLRLEGEFAGEEMGIILVDDGYIQELNLTYRGYDSPTDVLSFNLHNDSNSLNCAEGEVLGDVIISVERAVEQADLYGHTLTREVAFLAVHGILHLLGYDHQDKQEEEEMNHRQKFILSKFRL